MFCTHFYKIFYFVVFFCLFVLNLFSATLSEMSLSDALDLGDVKRIVNVLLLFPMCSYDFELLLCIKGAVWRTLPSLKGIVISTYQATANHKVKACSVQGT